MDPICMEIVSSVNCSGHFEAVESLEDLNRRYADALLPLTITFGCFTVIGIIGNLLVILVFSLSPEYRRNNLKVFALTLAYIDFITCLTLLPAETVKQQTYFAFGHVATCKIKCFFNLFGASSYCLALLVISVDRFRKVVLPFKKQMTPKTSMWILLCVACLFPILLSVPGTLMCGIRTTTKVNKYGTNTTIYLCETEKSFEKSKWRIIYKWALTSMLSGISCAFIILYSCLIFVAYRQLNKIASRVPRIEKNKDRFRAFRRRLSSKANSIRSLTPFLKTHVIPRKTFVWFILTLFFIITYVTHSILSLQVAIIETMTQYDFVLFTFFHRIYLVNHIVNPIVYAIFVKRFRDSCKRMCNHMCPMFK